MNTEKTFADRLKELRNIRNYTQEELGKITNISVQSIRRYEQGRLNEEPSAYNLLQLAKALDVTPEYLLIGDNNMPFAFQSVFTASTKSLLISRCDKIVEFNSVSLISDICP